MRDFRLVGKGVRHQLRGFKALKVVTLFEDARSGRVEIAF